MKPTFRQNSGFSLVELMVGMTISLLVGMVAISFLVSSSRSLTNKTNTDLIQENARFSLEFLSNNLRLAGMVNSSNTEVSQDIIPVFNRLNICTSGLTGTGSSSACNVDNETVTVSGVNFSSDRLAVEAVTSEPYLTCANTLIDPSVDSVTGVESIVTVFWAADNDSDGIASLYCQTYRASLDPDTRSFDNYTADSGVVPLVDGVQMFQYQLGVDKPDSSGNTDGNVDAFHSITNMTASDFQNVKAIKLGLLVSSGQSLNSEKNTELKADAKTYTVLEANHTTAATDRMLRQITSMTVFLPNKAS